MVEASWQPDPDDGTRLRWWDGATWTEHVAPGPQGQEVGPAPMRTAAGPPTHPGLAPATEDETGTGTGTGTTPPADDPPGGTTEPADDTPAGTTRPVDGTPVGTSEPADGAAISGDRPTSPDERDAPPPTWTAAATHEGGTEHRAAYAAPVWSVEPAAGADQRPARPFVTARAVHRIIAAIGVVMLVVASIQMIVLRSVSGDSVAEAFYNAVGWGLLGATIWGVCIYSMREIEAERAAARERARGGDPRTGRNP